MARLILAFGWTWFPKPHHHYTGKISSVKATAAL
jgi:hypothetical protein